MPIPRKPDALAAFSEVLRHLKQAERHLPILNFMVEGCTNRQIAGELGLKAKTVANYRLQIRSLAKVLGYEFLPKSGGPSLRLVKIAEPTVRTWLTRLVFTTRRTSVAAHCSVVRRTT